LIEQVLIDLVYKFDEADFAAALADYIENKKTEYIKTNYKYIISETYKSAGEAKKAVESGELSVNDAIKKYSVAYNYDEEYAEAYGFDTLPLNAMISNGIPKADVEKLIYLETGEVSHIISLSEEMHVVFIPDSVYRPSEAEIAESYKSMYEDEAKYNMFMAEFEKWMADAEAETIINKKALNNIDLDKLFELN